VTLGNCRIQVAATPAATGTCRPAQVVLEGLDTNVKRGRGVVEHGHVRRAARPAPRRLLGGSIRMCHRRPTVPFVCNQRQPITITTASPIADQILILSWCTSQRDLEVVRKVLAQACLAFRPEGGTTVRRETRSRS
jgi:hypothetical protein